MKHQTFLKNVLLAISKINPSIRIWQQPVGLAWTIDKKRMMKFGLPGQADLSGIMPNGIRLEIEIKVGRDIQSEKQINFQRMIEKNKGIYLVIKDDKPIQEQLKCLA